MHQPQNQPAYIIQMRAKPDSGDSLFELVSRSTRRADISDRFIILREDADPDVLWIVEIFRSNEVKEAYEASPLADQLREEVLEILAEAPTRIAAHPYSVAPE